MRQIHSGSVSEKSVKPLASDGGGDGQNQILDTSSTSHRARLAYKRAWYQRNKERIRERSRQQNRASYQRHIEKRRAISNARNKRVWQEQPEMMRLKMREWSRVWRARHPKERKENSRKYDLKRSGLTPADYDLLLTKQGGACAICQRSDPSGRRLAVDHCPATRRVRGLLCGWCNTALGKFRESPAIIRRALKYVSDDA